MSPFKGLKLATATEPSSQATLQFRQVLHLPPINSCLLIKHVIMNNWILIVCFLPLEAQRGQFRGWWYALFPPLAEICFWFKLYHLKGTAVTQGLQGLTVQYSLPEERMEESQILHLDYLQKSLLFFQLFDTKCY